MDRQAFAKSSMSRVHLLALVAMLLVVAVAIALRAAMLFSKGLPPGIDAGYYPMQARGLIENSKLPYVDVPLIFWIDAAVAKVLMAGRGMDIDSATLLASRLVDAVSQPLAAIPLALLMLGIAGALRSASSRVKHNVKSATQFAPSAMALIVTVFVVCAIAILSPPILRMTGDFQKNSLGLVWMGASAGAAYFALRGSGVVRWVLPVFFLGLAALTHIGAFGVSLVLVGSTSVTYVFFKWRLRPKTLALTGLACLLGAGILWLLMYTVAPSKAVGLAEGVTKMFTVGDHPQSRPAMAGGPERQGPTGDGSEFDRPMRDDGSFDRPGNRRIDRPPGPPGGFASAASPLRAIAWAALLGVGGIAVWRARRVGTPEAAVVSGAVLTAALITCPLIQGQYAERLSLMTPIPLAIIAGFLLLSWSESSRRWVRISGPAIGALAGVAIVVAAFPMAMRGNGGAPPTVANNGIDSAQRQRTGGQGGDRPGGGGGGSVVADEAVPEFRSMRGIVPTDGSAVVIARHGLQWWAGYFLKTPVREEHATSEQLEKYDRVFILREVQGEPGGPTIGGPEGRQGLGRTRGSISPPANSRLVFDGKHYRLFEASKAEFGSTPR